MKTFLILFFSLLASQAHASYVPNAVYSNGTKERAERVTVTGSATPTIATQSGSWVSSLTRNALGDVTVNIAASTFSSAPTCTVSPMLANVCSFVISTSTSAVRITTQTCTAGAAGDYSYQLLCMGPR